ADAQRPTLLGPSVAADLNVLGPDSTPRALQIKALYDVRFGGSRRNGIDRAIAQLEQARATAPTSARVLNDLAVAYLAQAERDQTLRPLVAGLDAAEHALERDSLFAPELFNRALLLERLYLLSSARLAWDQYVRLETDKGWRSEAASHLTALSRKLDAV